MLAALGSVAMLGFGLLLLMAVGAPDPEPAFGETSSSSSGAGNTIFVIAAIAVVVAAIVLAVGAVTLYQRKMIGRWLVVGGSAVAVLVSVLILAGFTALMGDSAGYAFAAGLSGPAIFGLIFPIATLVLALLPSTATWIRAKQTFALPPYPPPYRG